MSTVEKFEDLEVWKLARELCQDVFQFTLEEAFARDFGLKNQIRDSSESVMDNIAEGFERDGTKEFVQFLSISKGSCGESRSQLYRALDRNYITIEQFERLSHKIINLGRKISNLMIYLKNSEMEGNKFKPTEPQEQQKPKEPKERLKQQKQQEQQEQLHHPDLNQDFFNHQVTACDVIIQANRKAHQSC